MIERKDASKVKRRGRKVPIDGESIEQNLDNIELNNLSDNSSVTDVDILTKNGPNKDDQNEENERTDGSLRK